MVSAIKRMKPLKRFYMKNILPNNLKAMKRVLGIFTIAAFMVACNQAPKVDSAQTNTALPDTTGLSQFQAWKAQNELMQMNAMQQPQAAQPTRTVERYYYNSPRSSSSSSRSRSTTSRRGSSGGSYGSSSGSTASTRKKGWSKAAKGAVIGGVAGGAAGAIINKKNRVAGGAVGAVVGAAGGYILGRTMDKKDGRY
jgi:hypothetical protein